MSRENTIAPFVDTQEKRQERKRQMMNAEEKLFVSLCDNPLIREGWVPKVGDNYFWNKKIRIFQGIIIHRIFISEVNYWVQKKDCIFLPHLDQLLDMLGEGFLGLDPYQDGFDCHVNIEVHSKYFGISKRIAAIKAVLEVRKEEKL